MNEDVPHGREKMKNQVRPSLDGRQSGPARKSEADTRQKSTDEQMSIFFKSTFELEI